MTSEDFAKLMTVLRVSYPQRVNDAEHWRAMVKRYEKELAVFPDAVLANAFAIAWRQFPSFFPSLGELADFCSAVAKRRAMASAVKRLPEVSSAPGEITPEVREMIAKVKSL